MSYTEIWLHDVNDLERLAPEWSALWEQCPWASPFQTPEWMLSWWRTLGHGQLLSLALRHHGTLCALAPCFAYCDPEGVRCWLFLGTSVTDQLDILLADPCHLPALWQAIEKGAHAWDVLDWQEVTERSFLLTWQPLQHEASGVCPVISLPASAEEFRRNLPAGLRRNLRRYREQLEADGDTSFHTAESQDTDELLAAFFRLHAARWQSRGEAGMLQEERVRCFHRAVAQAMGRRSLLRLYGVRWRGEWVAVVYAFAAHGRGYSYLGGFEPTLGRYSLGTLIMGYAIEQSIAEGLQEWDFLRGAEPYKYTWGARDRPNWRCYADTAVR